MAAKMRTLRPVMGDVVIFPNGIELNYSEHDETVVVVAPKDCGVVFNHRDGLLAVSK